MEILNRDALVVYRLPFENSFKKTTGKWKESKDLKPEANSFVLAPFNSLKHPIIYVSTETSETVQRNEIASYLKENLAPYPLGYVEPAMPYKEMVQQGIDRIKAGYYDKLVLSRRERKRLPLDFDYVSFIEKMSSAHPECFIYMILIPEKMCWMGASPELLGKFDEKEFKTVAIAGTMSDEETMQGKDWTEKELEEQAFVTDFIIEQIEKVTEERPVISGPDDFKTGNLHHLKTEIHSICRKESSLEIIKSLHPTPAIAGTPRDQSLDYLYKNEGYDREYYSGFVGYFDENECGEFYVNLRCMQVFKEYIELYAGAGITAGSDPENEFVETARKLAVLKRFIDA